MSSGGRKETVGGGEEYMAIAYRSGGGGEMKRNAAANAGERGYACELEKGGLERGKGLPYYQREVSPLGKKSCQA